MEEATGSREVVYSLDRIHTEQIYSISPRDKEWYPFPRFPRGKRSSALNKKTKTPVPHAKSIDVVTAIVVIIIGDSPP